MVTKLPHLSTSAPARSLPIDCGPAAAAGYPTRPPVRGRQTQAGRRAVPRSSIRPPWNKLFSRRVSSSSNGAPLPARAPHQRRLLHLHGPGARPADQRRSTSTWSPTGRGTRSSLQGTRDRTPARLRGRHRRDARPTCRRPGCTGPVRADVREPGARPEPVQPPQRAGRPSRSWTVHDRPGLGDVLDPVRDHADVSNGLLPPEVAGSRSRLADLDHAHAAGRTAVHHAGMKAERPADLEARAAARLGRRRARRRR